MSYPSEAGHGVRAGTPGEIDYRLARQAIVAEYRKGRIARNEVCDAHPELRRVAVAHGTTTKRSCPICEEHNLVLVTFVFGPRLPAQGRCMTKKGELVGFAKRRGNFAAYVIEVCTGCWWNHLDRSFLLGASS